MASSYICCNLLFVNKDELAERALTKSSIFIPTPIACKTSILAHAPVFAPVPGLLGMYINLDLQKVTKLVCKSFVQGQKYKQLQANLIL